MEVLGIFREMFRPLQQIMFIIVPALVIAALVMFAKKRVIIGSALLGALLVCFLALAADYLYDDYRIRRSSQHNSKQLTKRLKVLH